ncbi:MAG: stage III sporulation protein AE [Lachnospiraceae bacterium]|nr:stage III sporulation protein AE [Lachnospiraceae bacterium]
MTVKKWMVRFACGLLLFVFVWGNRELCVHAKEEEEAFQEFLTGQAGKWELDEVQSEMTELFPEISMDLEEILVMLMKGNLAEALSELGSGIREAVLGEITGMRRLFVSILVIGICSALFSNFADVFSGRQVSRIGFYFMYLFLISVLLQAFASSAKLAVLSMENAVLFVKLFIPTYFMTVGACGGSMTAVFYYQLMLVAAYLIESFLLHGLLPFVYSYVLLALLNGIWSEERLTLLLDLIKKGITLVQKTLLGVITSLSLVQSVIVPALDGLKITAFKKTLAAIPGAGGVASGMSELMLGSAVLIKNSMGVLFLLLLLFVCIVPLCKLFLVGSFMKCGAALTGIVSDKKISGCVDRVGEGCFLLVKCLLTSVALFMIVIGVVAYSS